MYTQIKVAKLVMSLNVVKPGFSGRLVRRHDTLAVSYDSVRSTFGPLVRGPTVGPLVRSKRAD